MAQSSYVKEKSMLMAEKKTLTDMLYKFQDQLNRLKIEELALKSLMKMQAMQSSKKPGKSNGVSNSLDSVSDIGSLVSKASGAESYKETLNLNVDTHEMDDLKRLDDFIEEEEDEEEEVMDETNEEDYNDQLKSYMY
ncbi:snRNA-activating protein complex subunit 5-like [Physella acuta]|uniref:snRNA-activating protein complex subunit 5-like n=1 Tax=Physella acuta TaxID=109671 RepID=UPI0027DC7E17|nr:snRNA-activating protein complex subunit 5-like [Physella acuta]